MSMLKTHAAAWNKIAAHFSKLAAERADEGTSVQLACLVLAQYSVCQWSGDYGGPTSEMVVLAENIAGTNLDEMLAAELAKMNS